MKIRIIRASVDALCRDGTSEISRDPHTKRLLTRRESLAYVLQRANNSEFIYKKKHVHSILARGKKRKKET